MLIILGLYILLIWVIFSKLKIVKWGWLSGSVTVMIGGLILAVFMGLFNNLTPSGRFVIVARVAEVTPNVPGQVVELPAESLGRLEPAGRPAAPIAGAEPSTPQNGGFRQPTALHRAGVFGNVRALSARSRG